MPFDTLLIVYCMCGMLLSAYGIFLAPPKATIIELCIGGLILFIGWPIIVTVMIYKIMTDERF